MARAVTRRITIDGKDYPYLDKLAWPGVATLPGLAILKSQIGTNAPALAYDAEAYAEGAEAKGNRSHPAQLLG
jgi:hypothetical protein